MRASRQSRRLAGTGKSFSQPGLTVETRKVRSLNCLVIPSLLCYVRIYDSTMKWNVISDCSKIALLNHKIAVSNNLNHWITLVDNWICNIGRVPGRDGKQLKRPLEMQSHAWRDFDPFNDLISPHTYLSNVFTLHIGCLLQILFCRTVHLKLWRWKGLKANRIFFKSEPNRMNSAKRWISWIN